MASGTANAITQSMKLNKLIKSVAKLVECRETIDHGSIRMLHSDQAVRDIESAEGCDEVDTATVGDDDLAEELNDLAEDGERIAELDIDDVWKLQDAYLGEDISDYLDTDKEDELRKLDFLINAARELV